jgi:RimJ/RimL family protein N-acetyltransferase
MIQFKLDPKDFNYLGIKCNIIPVTFMNVDKHINLIIESIGYFHDEINWDEMFTTGDALWRIRNGMVMYILMGNDEALGHVWFSNHPDGRLLYNLFVRNKVNPKPYSGKEFVSDVINRYEYNKVIHCEVDEWNEKSIRLFKKVGFK